MDKILLLIVVITHFSCQNRKPIEGNIVAENLTQTQIDSVLNKFKFQYENPIVLDSSDHILIPISTQFLKGKRSYSKDGYYNGDFPRYWNILFYNRVNEKTHLLTEKKFRISDINVGRAYNDENKTVLNGKILYNITDQDYNNDGKLDHLDPDNLFVSNLDGKNLQRISNPNEDLIYYEVLNGSREIIYETIRDTKRDSIFNADDEHIWYKSKIVNGKWVQSEIIDAASRKNIEQLYFDQWLRKN